MDRREKITLSKRNVEAIPAPPTGETIVWDDRLRGFGVRVSATGRRTYFIQRRTESHRQIKLKLGVHGDATADQARKLAELALGKLAGGGNPAADRAESREQEARRRAIPTVAMMCERYLVEHAQRHKRPSSIADDAAMIRNYIVPAFGAKRVPDVKRSDISGLHRSIERRHQANRVVALLSKMFNLAVTEWELRSDNPAKGIKRNHEEARDRYLDDTELARLVTALAAHPNQIAANAIRLLLLTGARRGEAFSATWDQFDLAAGTWTKPSSHTKQKRVHRLPLSGPARSLLSEIHKSQRRRPSRYVFPARIGDGPMTEIKKSWAAICKAADLGNLRVHDLRHCHASMLAGAGESLPIIGALLGHSQPSTTSRYVHLVDRVAREATERVGAKLDALIGETASGEVVAFRGGPK